MTKSKTYVKGDMIIQVTANAMLLAAPGGPIRKWTNAFQRFAQKHTAAAAPHHGSTINAHGVRSLRPHSIVPLKKTIQTQKLRVRNLKGGPRVYGVVGSNSHYAIFVDQGTGAHQAKLLPPWSQGSPSLFESTWAPGPGQPAVGTITVRGQKGQGFFDEGLRKAFLSMKMRSIRTPADPKMGDAMRTWPKELERVTASGALGSAYLADLPQWRAWKRETYNAKFKLGRDQRVPRAQSKAGKATRDKAAQAQVVNRKNMSRSKQATEDRKKKQARELAEQELRIREGREKRAKEKRDRKAHADRVSRGQKALRDARMWVADFEAKNLKKGGTENAQVQPLRKDGIIVGAAVVYSTPDGKFWRKHFGERPG